MYGTAKVLMAYRDLGLMDSPEAQRGVAWLVANQNADGGWGSGVWGKAEGIRGAGFGVREEKGRNDTDHVVLSTQYSVPSTQSQIPNSKFQIRPPSPEPRVPSPLTSSVEETALAVEALLATSPAVADSRNATEGVPYSAHAERRSPIPDPLLRGLAWLIDRVEAGQHRQPAPIGFYFAKLWYYEKLYPLTFTVAALGRACRQFAQPAQTAASEPPHP